MSVVSNLSGLLGGVRDAFVKKTAAVEDSYASAVRAAAESKPLPPEKVLAVLEAAGKAPSEFESDVGTMRERVRLAELVGGEADRLAERDRLEAERRAALAELTRAKEAYFRVAGPVMYRLRQLQLLVPEVTVARQQLFDGCRDHRRVRWEELRAEEAALWKERRAAADLLDSHRGRLSDAEARQGRSADGLYGDTVEGCRYRVAGQEKVVAGVDARLARVRAELARVEDAMRLP